MKKASSSVAPYNRVIFSIQLLFFFSIFLFCVCHCFFNWILELLSVTIAAIAPLLFFMFLIYVLCHSSCSKCMPRTQLCYVKTRPLITESQPPRLRDFVQYCSKVVLEDRSKSYLMKADSQHLLKTQLVNTIENTILILRRPLSFLSDILKSGSSCVVKTVFNLSEDKENAKPLKVVLKWIYFLDM